MMCKCGSRMTKLYRHWNQHHVSGQWEPILYWCSHCRITQEIKEQGK